MRLRLAAVVLASLVLAAGCGEDPASVGLPCVMERPAVGSVRSVETPALDCEARMCLQLAASQPALCTAGCGEPGAACTPESTALCPGGEFRCRTPFVVGPFAGQPMCVCEAFLE